MYRSVVSAQTNLNATETTLQLIDTLTVPQGVKKIVGVAMQINGAGTTTLEGLCGYFQLESDTIAPWGGTQQFLIGGILNGNGAGWLGLNPYVHPTDIPVAPGGTVKISAALDLAQTINPHARAQVIYE